jgi:hypothetical protein
MSGIGTDEPEREDRPQDLPAQQSAVDSKEAKKRENAKQLAERKDRAFLRTVLNTEEGRAFLWSILDAAGTFSEKYGFGPYGHPNEPASERYAGQRDLGLRLYHTWLVKDHDGVSLMLHEHHPQFPRPPKGK